MHSVSISVLRTAFDKLGGLALTERMRGSKRARRLPETLPTAEVARLIAAGSSLRDRLLLGLLAHLSLETTLEHRRLLTADGVRSPADALGNAAAATGTPATPAGGWGRTMSSAWP